MWLRAVRAMTRIGQDQSQDYLWEGLWPRFTVYWYVSVTIGARPPREDHLKAMMAWRAGLWIFVHRHTNATSQMCRYTHMKTQTQSRPSYFFLKRSHKASLERTHSLYGNRATTCKQSACLAWAKHRADVQQGKFLDAYIQHTVDHYIQLIYDIFKSCVLQNKRFASQMSQP